MEAKYYPVSIDELKNNLRIPSMDTSKDSSLCLILEAAFDYAEKFTGYDLASEYEGAYFPSLLKYAILMTASALFQHPADRPFTIPTQAQHLFKQYQKNPYGNE